jgi:uncharacterized protein YjdB
MNIHYKTGRISTPSLKTLLAAFMLLTVLMPFAMRAQTYCEPQVSPVGANSPTEPISLVQFGSGANAINNASSAEVSTSVPKYEDFTAISMTVEKGSTYTLVVKGNTDGNNTNYITVYIDWNQDGTFSNSLSNNEKYQYTPALINSNGADDIEMVYDITIPTEALTGHTVMRVVKNYQAPSPSPCYPVATFGQTEDYTLIVAGATAVQSVAVTTQNSAPAAITTANGTLQLTASVLPATVSQNVTWSITQGSAYATVSANGLVTAIGNGTVTVTATSVSDTSVSGSLQITVSNQTAAAACTFAAVAVTGFNADVIAEGTGANANARATQPIDGANGYYSQDFVPANPHSSGASAAAYGGGFPNNGTVNSAAVSGLSFQLASYTGNNALVLRNSLTNTGTLTFTQQKKAQKVYLAWVSAEGTNDVDVTVNFADGTSQVFTAQQAADWWSDTTPGASIKAAGPLGRVSVITTAAWAPVNSFSGLTQTYLFQKELELNSANYNKLIASVSFIKATSANAATTTAILGVSICETPAVAIPQNGPVTITAGFNHDIIANGVGNASASSTIGFDQTNSRALVSLDFQATASSALPTYGLPVNGTINSVQTNGVTFQLADYNGNNALFLTPTYVGNGAPNNGTLAFSAQNVGTIYILAGAAGGGVQNLPFTATINFSDATTQAATLTVGDWYNGNSFAIKGMGRVNRANNNLEGDSNNPRLYEISLPVDAANQAKTITGISFSFNGDQSAEYGSEIRMSVLAITTADVTETPVQQLTVVTNNNVPAAITEPQGTIELHGVYNGQDLYGTSLIWSIAEGGTGTASIDIYGKVTGIANGTVIAHAKLTDNDAVYGELTITISGQTEGYCDAYFINGCNEYVYIASVATTGATININNQSTGCSNDNSLSGYANYTAQSASAPQGSTVTFTMGFNTPGLGTAYLSAWIDWNQDFIFSDSEQIYASTGEEPDNLTFTVIVPANATLGTTRIRLKAVNGWIGGGACGFNSYGEVEDYTFTVTQPVVVSTVTVATQNNAAAEITAANGTLQLTATVNPAAANQNVTWSITSGNTFASVAANGLVTAVANGTVTVRATSVADATKYGELNVVINTGSSNECPSLTSLYENFDTLSCCAMGVVPTCWESIRLGNASQIISSTNPASGTSQIYQNGYGSGVVSIVVLPHFSNVNAGTHQFRFKVKANSTGALDFGYITDTNDAATFVVIQSLTITNSSYNSTDAERTLSVPSTVPANARLAIRNPGTTWAGIYWDDVYWEPIPVSASITVATQNNIAATITADNGTLQLTATVTPTGQTVNWTVTEGTANATVTANGLVTAVANGTVTVRATIAGTEIYDEITITISNQVIPVTIVTVTVDNSAPATITVDGGTLQLEATVTPANATNTDVIWTINQGGDYATIDENGEVTATANGTVTVRATAADGTVYGEISITITGQVIPVTAVTVSVENDASATITVDGGTLQLEATIVPANATNTDVIWTITEGADFATVDANGVVTAIANGTVTVRATAADGTVYGDITITVTGQVIPVTAVTVSVENDAPATITTDGGTLQLEAAIAPSNATNTDVTWTITEGADYATVDANGVVTATANGTVTVRATAADGTVYGEITVTITGQVIAVTAITVTVENDAEPTITTQGGTLQLIATVTPADATVTDVTWSITEGADFATVDTNGVVTAIANGTVTVRATAADGTVYGEIEVTINLTMGLGDVTALRFSIYPNPTTGILNISANSAVKDVMVYNMLGQQVLHGNQNQVNLQVAEQGVYSVQVQFENGTTISQKVVKN